MSPPDETPSGSNSGLHSLHPVTGADLVALVQRISRKQDELQETVLSALRGTLDGKPGVHQRLDKLETFAESVSESRRWATRLIVGLVLATLIPIGFVLLRMAPPR